MTAPWQLKVLLVEEESASRTIMRQMLRQIGLTDVRLLKNGAALLRQFDDIDADLLLLDYEFGEQLRGPDLVRFLLRRQRLKPYCRVVFITAQPDAVLADLPYLPLPCRVVAKPVSQQIVFDVLRETAVMLDQSQQLLRAMQNEADSETLRRLIRIRAGQLPLASRDALRDANGVPVIGNDGRFVTDPSAPRRIAFDVDGLLWDVGVMWRPSSAWIAISSARSPLTSP